MRKRSAAMVAGSVAATIGLISAGLTVGADQVILDDLIVDGSICAGQDCVNGESFGFDTIRIKENNLRIRAVDTSSTASFPTNDWQLTFNDSSNGGANKFSIDDIDGGRTPFTLTAGAPNHSIFVSSSGRVGLGTNNPVVKLHQKDGNTPTLRLEQDGTSGFGAQTWDMAGNEANFFIRDASNGSTLPFRIFPGAPSNALTIEATTGDIGIGTTSPKAPVDIVEPAADNDYFRLTEDAGSWVFRVNDSGVFSIADPVSGLSPVILRPGAPQGSLDIKADGAIDIFSSATAPAATQGGLYFDTTNGTLCVSNGTSWFEAGAPATPCV